VSAPACATGGSASASDAAYGGGQLRAVTSWSSAGCDGQIWFAAGGSQGWTRSRSPYRGVVLGVAADDTATYLLYVQWDASRTPLGLAVTKRTHDGRYFPSTVLSRTAGTGAVATNGDVAARGGRWWAVWSQQVGPGGEFAHQQLFQAGTVAGLTVQAAQATTTATDVEDSEPSISLDAAGAVLAWTRQSQPARPGPADVWVAVSSGGTWQRARAFSTAGTDNVEPDVLRSGAVTVVGWSRDGRVVTSDNSTGAFREHVFLVRGGEPRVGVAGGSLLTAWTAGTETDASYRVLFARSPKGGNAWESSYLSSYGEPLQALVGVNGRATAVIGARTSVVSRTG
jgi:hypothetical protein